MKPRVMSEGGAHPQSKDNGVTTTSLPLKGADMENNGTNEPIAQALYELCMGLVGRTRAATDITDTLLLAMATMSPHSVEPLSGMLQEMARANVSDLEEASRAAYQAAIDHAIATLQSR